MNEYEYAEESDHTPFDTPYFGFANSATWAFNQALLKNKVMTESLRLLFKDTTSREEFRVIFTTNLPPRIAKEMSQSYAGWGQGLVDRIQVADSFFDGYNASAKAYEAVC